MIKGRAIMIGSVIKKTPEGYMIHCHELPYLDFPLAMYLKNIGADAGMEQALIHDGLKPIVGTFLLKTKRQFIGEQQFALIAYPDGDVPDGVGGLTEVYTTDLPVDN